MSMRVANPTINPTGLNANQMLQFGLAQSAVKLVESGKLSEANQLLKLAVDPNEIPNKISEIEELLSIGGEDAISKFKELIKMSGEPGLHTQKFKDTEKVMARVKEIMGSNNERQEDDLIEIDLGIDWDVTKHFIKRVKVEFSEEEKEILLTLIRVMVLGIVIHDNLYNGDASKLSTSAKKFQKPHLINGERISLHRLYQWEKRVRGKKEDGSEYSMKEIMDIWKNEIFGTDANEVIEVLPVDIEITELRKMSLLHIRSLVWALVTYSKDYNGDSSKLSTSAEKFRKPHLVNGERISLQRLYQWEKRVRGEKEDGSEYLAGDIIKDWKRDIFGIKMVEKKIKKLSVNIKIPPLKEMTLWHIHSLVWIIVMNDKGLYDGDASKLSSYPVKFQEQCLVDGKRISLLRLYYWEKRVRGKKKDGSEYSKKEIINIWRDEIDWSRTFSQKKNSRGVVVLVEKNEDDDPTLTPILNSSRLLSRLIADRDYRSKIKGELLERWIRPYEYNAGKTIFLINKFRDEIENEDVKALIEEVVNEIGEYSEMKASGR